MAAGRRGGRGGRGSRAAVMTRLLREHPLIDAELDEVGRLVAIRWNGTREPIEVCNRWRVEGSPAARAHRAGLLQGGGGDVAGARVPRPDGRYLAPGAALRLSRPPRGRRAGGDRSGNGLDRQRVTGDPSRIVITNSESNSTTTRTRTPRSRGCVVCTVALTPKARTCTGRSPFHSTPQPRRMLRIRRGATRRRAAR